MKTSSAKAKGRRLQQTVRDKLLAKKNYALDTPVERSLQTGDVVAAVMGESGVDIKLSPWAKVVIPFDIECKNTETASVWSWMKQAKANTTQGRKPCVVFTRNREGDVYAVVRFDDLVELL